MNPTTLRRLGWLAFIFMWIPFIGIFVGMIGLPSGSYAWSELPSLARYSTVAVGIFFVLSMTGLFGSMLVGWWSNRRVLREGERAEAVVLDIWDTGTTINNNPLVGLRLEVHPLTGPIFMAETETVFPRLQVHQLEPGMRLPVRYDAKDLSVALVKEEMSIG